MSLHNLNQNINFTNENILKVYVIDIKIHSKTINT